MGTSNSARQVGIIGASGFLGSAVAARFAAAGYRVVGFARGGTHDIVGVCEWRDSKKLEIGGLDVLINFAGKRIDCRWTRENRQQIAASRAGFSGRLVAALAQLAAEDRPAILVNGSATGYYGDCGDRVLDESAGSGGDFLAGICRDWESAAARAESVGIRVVQLRTGFVLGRKAVSFRRLKRLFQLGLGGKLGDGRQWMPWIHVTDFVEAVLHLAGSKGFHGACNVCAPSPVTNSEFTKCLAARMGRPAVFPVPGWVLRSGLGGFGAVLLGSQRAVPSALLRSGFAFRFGCLEDALEDLCAGTHGG